MKKLIFITLLFLVGCSSNNDNLQPTNNGNSSSNTITLDQNLFGRWIEDDPPWNYERFITFEIVDSVGRFNSYSMSLPQLWEEDIEVGIWWTENNKLFRENGSTGNIEEDSYSINTNTFGEVSTITIDGRDYSPY
jgi:hypothetical protein